MDQRADHPHQAAVHLMKSLKCCKDCYDVSQADYLEIHELQFQRDVLAKQLSKLQPVGEERSLLLAQIQDLQYLLIKIRQQNSIAYDNGLKQLEKMKLDREMFEKNKRQNCHMELVAERDRFTQLNIELQKLMQQVRHLHRVNEELVHRFTNY